MLTSQDAFLLIQEAGIIQNKQTFLRYVREGRIKGNLLYKRKGYRFKEENIKQFIEAYHTGQFDDPKQELQALRKENATLHRQLEMQPYDLINENVRLTKRIVELEEQMQTKHLQPSTQYG